MENLRITESIQQNLLSAAKWLKFLTVLSTIAMVILFLIGVLLLFVPGGIETKGTGVAYMIGCAIYYYPLMKAFAIVNKTRDAMNNGSQESMEDGANGMRQLLKYVGVLSIIGIVIYVIGIIAAISLVATGAIAL